MSTSLLDLPTETTTTTPAVNRLRNTMAAIRLSFIWFGVRKSLTTDQKPKPPTRLAPKEHFCQPARS